MDMSPSPKWQRGTKKSVVSKYYKGLCIYIYIYIYIYISSVVLNSRNQPGKL